MSTTFKLNCEYFVFIVFMLTKNVFIQYFDIDTKQKAIFFQISTGNILFCIIIVIFFFNS